MIKLGMYRRPKIIIATVVGILLLGSIAWGVMRFLDASQEPSQADEPVVSVDMMREMSVMNGTLQEYDRGEQTIAVKDETGEVVTFWLHDQATISRGISSETIEMSDIPSGEAVSVSHSPGNRAFAVWQAGGQEEGSEDAE